MWSLKKQFEGLRTINDRSSAKNEELKTMNKKAMIIFDKKKKSEVDNKKERKTPEITEINKKV